MSFESCGAFAKTISTAWSDFTGSFPKVLNLSVHKWVHVEFGRDQVGKGGGSRGAGEKNEVRKEGRGWSD